MSAKREDGETFYLKVEGKLKVGSLLKQALAGRDARAPGY